MYLLQENSAQSFTSILNKLSISIYKFDINQCEERTFFITIRFWNANHFVFGDLIYLLDREEFFGALSLNHLYSNVLQFFEKNFNYSLLHTDEIHIARLVATNPKFQEYMQQYNKKFPKHKLNLLNSGSVSKHN